MKTAFKTILWVAAAIGLFLAIIAGMSSASEWFLLSNYDGYQKKNFVIDGVYKNGSEYYLRGTVKDEEFEFAVVGTDYQRFSHSGSKGQIVEIYINPEMPSLVFQQKSLNVIFAEQWRDPSELKVSAKSTLWIAIILLLISFFLCLTARLVRKNAE